jgi:MYXO-CTERM domain-containing protein
MTHSSRLAGLLLGSLFCLSTLDASAFPGFFVGKNDTKRVLNTSNYVVMNSGEQSVVSVVTDYEGPFEPFAVVLAVPSDVTLERVTSIRREFVDRIDQMSAPRFMEFWEMDPCEPGKESQEWERDLRVQTSGDNFLGGAAAELGPTRKVPKELLLSVKTEQKSGEYTFFMPKEEQSFEELVKERGWVLTAPMQQALAAYGGQGMKFVLAEVDPNRIELIGGEKAQLSPIRFWSEQRYTKLPSKLGRLSAKGAQELFVFVLDHDNRFKTTNYEIVNAPTNIEVDFVVKERMAEFFAGLHDAWLAKHPKTFWFEYAWKADSCGQPCPNDPILINELLTLGGDVFETKVPKEELEPKVPPMTDEEKQKLKIELDGLPIPDRAKRKKAVEQERRDLVQRKALLERHKYVISRLHHRYADDGLPNDVEIGKAEGGLEGGIWIPKGEKGEVSREAKAADDFRYQTRYMNFHPWKGMQNCETPERYRWGKPPRTYRGLRKTWVVEDLARKSRTQIQAKEVIRTPIPELGLVREEPKLVGDAGLDAGTEAAGSGKGCGCRTAGGAHQQSGWLGLLVAAVGLGLRLNRRKRA